MRKAEVLPSSFVTLRGNNDVQYIPKCNDLVTATMAHLVETFCQEFSSLMSLFTKSVAVTPLAGMPDLVSSTWDDIGSGWDGLGCVIVGGL